MGSVAAQPGLSREKKLSRAESWPWEGWEQELAVPTAAEVTRDSRGSSCIAGTVLVSNTGPGMEHQSGDSSGSGNGGAPRHSLPWGHTRRMRMPWPVFGTQQRGHGEHNSTQSCCWPSTTGQHPCPWDHFLSSTRSHNPNDSPTKSPRTLWSFCCHRNAGMGL